tara:strand:+ start:198 stop:410 length:213 start_codon:yes stop_codon:yes gene_type:complete
MIEKRKTLELKRAQKHCCNWDNGNCLGVMMNTTNKKLNIYLDSKKEGKKCTADKKCGYYENIVKKIIPLL